MNHGYHNNPEATARAWRNGWFHTGDAFRARRRTATSSSSTGMKDAIRRRGENISSFEVEAEVCAHPAVREAAAVAVPSEFGEDEVLAVVALGRGRHARSGGADRLPDAAHGPLHGAALRPHRATLPKTPTQKVQKHLLRSEGITADTWDREKPPASA